EPTQRGRLGAKFCVGFRRWRVDGNEIAFAVDRIAMTREPEQQARVRIVALEHEEALERGIELVGFQISLESNLETLRLECPRDLLRVSDPIGELRPIAAIVAVLTDNQRLRLLVERDFLSVWRVGAFACFQDDVENAAGARLCS